MSKDLQFWFRFSLFNLILIAVYGVLMRYKIGFEFPFLNQKYLLHAHSHFAFTGWITQTLMVLMVMTIRKFLDDKTTRMYNKLFVANLVTAYGMLITFTIQGYGAFAIGFSTASIIISYIFAWKFIAALKTNAKNLPGKNWFIAALIFGILSTLGTFTLVYMMVTRNIHQDYYLASVYYFLHFQYNGWFFFACMGLLWNKLCEFVPGFSENKSIFLMFAGACIPAYFLSTLWMKFPPWLYWLIVLSAAIQVFAWGKMVILVKKHLDVLKSKVGKFGQYLFLFVCITLSIKLLLQLFSTIPIISKLAFGFRPIVIAYLHLVLLAIITVFIISWLVSFHHINANKWAIAAITVFISGVFLNEFALMVQGIASFSYFPIPYINEMLFVIALIMLIGAILLFYSQKRTLRESHDAS